MLGGILLRGLFQLGRGVGFVVLVGLCGSHSLGIGKMMGVDHGYGHGDDDHGYGYGDDDHEYDGPAVDCYYYYHHPLY